MIVIRGDNLDFLPASHEFVDNPGIYKKVLVKLGQVKEGAIVAINWAKVPSGKESRSHYHESMDEVFIIISGIAKIRSGSEEETLERGDAVIIKAGESHQIKNNGIEDAVLISVGVTDDRNGKTIV